MSPRTQQEITRMKKRKLYNNTIRIITNGYVYKVQVLKEITPIDCNDTIGQVWVDANKHKYKTYAKALNVKNDIISRMIRSDDEWKVIDN